MTHKTSHGVHPKPMDFKGLCGDTKKKEENKHKIHEHKVCHKMTLSISQALGARFSVVLNISPSLLHDMPLSSILRAGLRRLQTHHSREAEGSPDWTAEAAVYG